jgi:hypothetical protein
MKLSRKESVEAFQTVRKTSKERSFIYLTDERTNPRENVTPDDHTPEDFLRLHHSICGEGRLLRRIRGRKPAVSIDEHIVDRQDGNMRFEA